MGPGGEPGLPACQHLARPHWVRDPRAHPVPQPQLPSTGKALPHPPGAPLCHAGGGQHPALSPKMPPTRPLPPLLAGFLWLMPPNRARTRCGAAHCRLSPTAPRSPVSPLRSSQPLHRALSGHKTTPAGKGGSRAPAPRRYWPGVTLAAQPALPRLWGCHKAGAPARDTRQPTVLAPARGACGAPRPPLWPHRGHACSIPATTLCVALPGAGDLLCAHGQHGRLGTTLNKPRCKLKHRCAAPPPCHHGVGPALRLSASGGPVLGCRLARALVSLRQGQQSRAAHMRDVGHPAIKFLFIQHQPHTQGCTRRRQRPSPRHNALPSLVPGEGS